MIGLVGTVIVLVSIYSQNDVNKTERAVSSIIGIGF